jgi:uncharacterized membrane protein
MMGWNGWMPGSGVAYPSAMSYQGTMGGGMMGFGLGWLWMGLGIIIVFGLAIWLCASILGSHSKTTSTDPADAALDIVKQRYARGERRDQ